MTGKIKMVSNRGFGFIFRDEDHSEIFFHRSGCDDFEGLQRGDHVEYEEKSSPKGPVAYNVRVI